MKVNYTLVFVLAAVAVFYFWRYRRVPDIALDKVSVTLANGSTDNLLNHCADSSIVICYASWCGPCLKELRWLKESYSSYPEHGIHFYCLTDDSQEKVEVMNDNMPADIEFIRVPSLKELGIYTIPATFFIRNKTITEKQLDAIDWRAHQEILHQF